MGLNMLSVILFVGLCIASTFLIVRGMERLFSGYFAHVQYGHVGALGPMFLTVFAIMAGFGGVAGMMQVLGFE